MLRPVVLLWVAALIGCAARSLPPMPATPTLAASHAVASVPARRISTLLDFESPDDLTFITALPANSIAQNSRFAREGSHSLFISPGTRSIKIKLRTLLQGHQI